MQQLRLDRTEELEQTKQAVVDAISRLDANGQISNQTLVDLHPLVTDWKTDETTLRLGLHDLASAMTRLNEKSGHISMQKEVLLSLRFDEMRARYAGIPPAHAKTFEWIFEDDDTEMHTLSRALRTDTKRRRKSSNNPNSFAQWLKGSNGICWLSGKAGSGKSTLMKYVVRNKQTRE